MGLLLNRAKANTATTGTGAATPGSGVSPFRSWSAAGAGAGEWYFYLIEDGAAWETDLGYYNGTTITRPGTSSPYFESSTGALISLSGSATIACIASKKMQGPVLIGRTVLTGTAASISFTGIPAAFEDLEIVLTARLTSTGNIVRMRFNGDTGNNYDFNRENRFGQASGFAVSYIEAGVTCYSSTPANYPGELITRIPGYARTTFYKSAQGVDKVMGTSASNAQVYHGVNNAWWRNTAAITQVELFPDTGNFDVGTVCSLYGKG